MNKKRRKSKDNDIAGIVVLILLIIIIKAPNFNFVTRIAEDKNWPCVGHYTITSGYGYRNTNIPLATANHKGIDISCPVGTEVISVLDGTVSFTGYNKHRGYYIMVDHGGGVATLYQHGSANSFKAFVGQNVKAGQTIMLSGNSGISSGPHLHFEVKINGNNVNPITWLKSI